MTLNLKTLAGAVLVKVEDIPSDGLAVIDCPSGVVKVAEFGDSAIVAGTKEMVTCNLEEAVDEDDVSFVVEHFVGGNRRLPTDAGWVLIAGLGLDDESPATFQELSDWSKTCVGVPFAHSTLRAALNEVLSMNLIEFTGEYRRAGRRGPKQRLFRLTYKGRFLVKSSRLLEKCIGEENVNVKTG